MPTAVALVEDNETLRRRLIERLGYFNEVTLALAVESGEGLFEALSSAPADRHPQVILMDIELPAMSGIDATALLQEHYPAIDVIMLTVFEQDDKIFKAIQAGASGYLLKDVSTDQIVSSILELRRGGAPMSASVARRLLRFVREIKPPAHVPNTADTFALTSRELEILECIVRGETVATMAESLFLSPYTVGSHLKNIYRKLHVHSRAAAVRVALENQLLRSSRS